MGLFSRSSGIQVVVTPEAVRPRQTVTVTVTPDKPLDKVTSARLEWGYENHYRYHWAGRADSSVAASNDTWLTMDQVGTSYGSEKDGHNWVCVTRVDIPIATGEFAGTSASFTIPSWAPPSSDVLAEWACRLVVERGGRDIDARGEFRVLIGRSDVEAVEEPVERFWGDGVTAIDIVLASPVHMAGESISGHVVLRAQQDLPNGDLAVYLQREREHHPLERYPAQTGTFDGRIVQLNKNIPLKAGAEFGIPFELPVPADTAPSGDSVHSTLSWFVAARMMYSGFNAHQLERVRRPIVIVNAP